MMILQILTEGNAMKFLIWLIMLFGSALVGLVIWQMVRLINKIEHLDTTMSMNNTYLKQHYRSLLDHEDKLDDHHNRLMKLEFSKNGER